MNINEYNMMRHPFVCNRICLISVLLVLSLTACNPEELDTPVAVTAVSVSPASADMKVGQTLQLSAEILPANATEKTVSWTTSDASIASVDQNGMLSALKEGSAVITVTTQDGGKNGTCNVSVTKAKIEDIIVRSKVVSGTVTNGVKLSYSGTVFNRIYLLLPKPTSNEYQDITNFEAPGCTEGDCPDGVNHYIWKDINSSSEVPSSGDWVISETFDATVYNIKVDFSLMSDIPEYDPESEECKNYLGKEEGGLIDPTNKKIVSTANTLWELTGGSIIDYARECLGWTYANMTYGNMNTGLHTIANLMSTMTGDCGNYSSVFISLLRAKGIPARHIVMVHGWKNEYHVRAEFYIPSYGWIPADPTWGDGYFGVFEGDYIVMTRGINTILRGFDASVFRANLFQTFYYWYWLQKEGSDMKYTHSCTGLR